jgi:hypothetical protein
MDFVPEQIVLKIIFRFSPVRSEVGRLKTKNHFLFLGPVQFWQADLFCGLSTKHFKNLFTGERKWQRKDKTKFGWCCHY